MSHYAKITCTPNLLYCLLYYYTQSARKKVSMVSGSFHYILTYDAMGNLQTKY
jgi:hypothetical protein